MRSWYLSIPLGLLIVYGLYEYSDGVPPDDTSCELGKHTNYCDYIGKNCDNHFYSIALKFYCSTHYPSYMLRIITSAVIVIGLLLLLISLSLLVSNYLFPNLNDIAKSLHINDQILSSIIIPSTNAFGDFINYYVALNSNSTDLVMGQLLGSLFIIVTVIIGLISYLRPSKIAHAKWVLHELVWILVVLILLLYILSDGVITTAECLIMIAFYFCYVGYLLCAEKQIEPNEDGSHSICSVESIKSVNHNLNIDDAFNILSHSDIIRSPSPMRQIDEEIESLRGPESRPINILQLCLSSIDAIFEMFIPTSSSTLNDSKLLQIWQFCLIAYGINFQFFNFKFIDLVPLALTGILIIEFARPMIIKFSMLYQLVINIAGIFMSLIIMSQISKQVLKIFKNLGLILRISDYSLGLIVFSVSNSINDIITNLTVSTAINPMFGINSCLGTPLLLILLGIGMNGLILNLNHHELAFKLNTSLAVSLLALIATIIFYLIYIPLNNWKLDKKLGIIVITWWLVITICNFSLQ